MLSENELIAAIENQTKAGAEALYDSYSLLIYKVICCSVNDKALAEEILANVFKKIWNSIDEFHDQQNRLSVWIIGMARHFAKLSYTEVITINKADDEFGDLEISTEPI